MEELGQRSWRAGRALAAAGLLALAAGCGVADPGTPAKAEALRLEQIAYERLLAVLPDSALDAADPLDSLFLEHDLPALAQPPFDDEAAARWVDSTLAALTLDQKIGQLFIVHLPTSAVRRLLDDEARRAVERYGVGGFLVPRLMPPRTVFAETQRLQRISNVPLFFAADYERGAGRFNNALTELPSNMALGATRDTLLAAAAGRLTALESRALGVNLLFAPVVDVNNNAANPIINIRSYGEDPVLVGHMAAAFVREAERHGALTTLKHFPGHGNTEVDSHARMGVVSGDAAALDSVELRPYRLALRNRRPPAGVMSAHLWTPAFDPAPLPATFSRRALGDVLRDSLGFEGLVVTDDVRMGALQKTYPIEERIVRPLVAGADVILTPVSLPRAVEVVRAALRSGDLDEAALDRSVRHILAAKARAGLHAQRFADEATLDYLLEKPRGAYLAQTIADRAVTLLRTHPALPLRPGQRLTLLQLGNATGAESIDAAMDFFAETLAADDDVRLDQRPAKAAAEAALRRAHAADVVVLALYLRLKAGRGEAGLFPGQAAFVHRLLEGPAPVVLVTFGNPYAVIPFAEAAALVVAYDQSIESGAAVAGLLQGLQPPLGTLPVTVGGYPFGSGLSGVAAPDARR